MKRIPSTHPRERCRTAGWRQSANRGDERAKPTPDHDPGIAGGNTARVYNFEVTRLTARASRRTIERDPASATAMTVERGGEYAE